jgi:glycosyltransferase involved in cell wall biosynthesis
MRLGCPVVCSNTGSIPEVAINAGQYFNPTSSESLANAILLVVTDQSFSERLIATDQKRSQLFPEVMQWFSCLCLHNYYLTFLQSVLNPKKWALVLRCLCP